MIVAVAQFEFFMPFNQSLKEKRQILRKLKERVSSKFDVRLSEVDHHEKWQRASLGFALVGSDGKLLESIITKTFNFVDALGLGEVREEFRDLIYYE